MLKGVSKQAWVKREKIISDDAQIKVIHGYSSDIQLPEHVDLCVSEIIGNIVSSEGAISILKSGNGFQKHFL